MTERCQAPAQIPAPPLEAEFVGVPDRGTKTKTVGLKVTASPQPVCVPPHSDVKSVPSLDSN